MDAPGCFYLQLSVRVSRSYSHLPYPARLPKLIACPADQGVYPAVCPESTLSCGMQVVRPGPRLEPRSRCAVKATDVCLDIRDDDEKVLDASQDQHNCPRIGLMKI